MTVAQSNTFNQHWYTTGIGSSRPKRAIIRPRRLIDEIRDVQNYYACLAEFDHDKMGLMTKVVNANVEFNNVGAGLGGGFKNTNELRPMKYKEAINGPDGEARKEEIKNEHNQMLKNKMFEVTKRNDLPKGATTITSTWACKKKSNGTLRGRLNAHGFKQRDREHYDSTKIHAPVTNAITVRIILTMMVMAGWIATVVDVKGAFLHGKFEDGEAIHYQGNVVLRLVRTLYRLKQAAMTFWQQLLKCMGYMEMKRSSADPCL